MDRPQLAHGCDRLAAVLIAVALWLAAGGVISKQFDHCDRARHADPWPECGARSVQPASATTMAGSRLPLRDPNMFAQTHVNSAPSRKICADQSRATVGRASLDFDGRTADGLDLDRFGGHFDLRGPSLATVNPLAGLLPLIDPARVDGATNPGCAGHASFAPVTPR